MEIARLRAATAADHDAVEDSMPLMDAGLDRERYVAVLLRLYGVVAAWETLLQKHAPAYLAGLVPERLRLGLLEHDLLSLHAAPAGELAQMPSLPTGAHLLGAMYVMEGSRLGGQLIARHVDAVLHLEAGAGSSYFHGSAEKTGPQWKEFLEVLRTQVADDETEVTIAGAKAMFATFGAWMRQALAAESVAR